jgi:peptidoglycan hydrolase-like amidase
MSQYGTYDLAELGYDYEHIINAYFTDVSIVYYKNIEELQS